MSPALLSLGTEHHLGLSGGRTGRKVEFLLLDVQSFHPSQHSHLGVYCKAVMQLCFLNPLINVKNVLHKFSIWFQRTGSHPYPGRGGMTTSLLAGVLMGWESVPSRLINSSQVALRGFSKQMADRHRNTRQVSPGKADSAGVQVAPHLFCPAWPELYFPGAGDIINPGAGRGRV